MSIERLFDVEAEAHLIGFLVSYPNHADPIRAQIVPADFHHPAWASCWSMWEPGMHPHDLADISGADRAELDRAIAGGPSPGMALGLVSRLLDLSARRQIHSLGAEMQAAATQSHDVPALIDRFQVQAGQLHAPLVIGPPDRSIADIIGGDEPAFDWVIGGLLEAGDRLLITSGEGLGKSMLLAQFAVCAAAGIHPWTFQRTRAVNVLYIDLENGDRLVRRRLRDLYGRAPSDFDPDRMRVIIRPYGIDVTRRADAVWLAERVAANRPELLVIGPAYRLYAGGAARGDIGGEDHARTVTAALDKIRDRGTALVLETHAPHASMGQRDLRPFGSSVWLRWPEFGIGLKPEDESNRRFKVQHWRGPRAERKWPQYLDRGGKWPWTGVYHDGTF